MKKEGGWIFISHSHLDIEIVRKIRNQLESQGFDPLMFYLKCLNDDDEIESLIKREINAREWFIYVESENSVKSHWVQSERAYIAQLSGKKIFTIDVNQDISKQLEKITKQLKIYISYSHKDRPVYEAIKRALLKRDFLVFDDYDIPIGVDWKTHIITGIAEAVRNGFVLLLYTEDASNSEWIQKEIAYAEAAKGKIIPIYIGDSAPQDLIWKYYLSGLQSIHYHTVK